MKEEISAAVVFIAKIVKKSKHLNAEEVRRFSEQLAAVLMARFKNHWYEDRPSKGQGYRCIRCSIDEPRDAALEEAAASSGLDYAVLNLPVEMTLWVDPREVTCRFGERGTCCTIAAFGGSLEGSPAAPGPDGGGGGGDDDNGNSLQVRIPSPSTVFELSRQEDKLKSRRARHHNYHNDLYHAQYSSYSSPPPRNTTSSSRRPPQPQYNSSGDKYHWVNGTGAVVVQS